MFFAKLFAILAIAVAVEIKIHKIEITEDSTSLINDINEVVLVQRSKTVSIFVCDGNIQFVTTKENSEKSFHELGVPIEKVPVFEDTFESLNPIDILMKLAKLRAKHETFVLYLREDADKTPVPKPLPKPPSQANSSLPEVIIKEITNIIVVIKSNAIAVLVVDGSVKFVSTEADSEKLLKQHGITLSKIEIIGDTFDPENPTDIVDKLNNYRKTRTTFLIYFRANRPKPPDYKPLGLLVPEYLIYDLDDLMLVQKVKTIVIFVRNGKVQFASSERDYPNKLAENGYSVNKVEIKKETYESLNPFDILGKLSKINYDTDTFLVYFTEVAGTQLPEVTDLINDITNIVLIKKIKNCVILVSGGRVKFVTTEAEVDQKMKQLGISSSGLKIIKDTFEPKNPFDILGKLTVHRSEQDSFLVYFKEGTPSSTGFVFPEPLVNEINVILLVKKSKNVAIYVLDGKIEFVTTEADSAGKLSQFGRPPTNLETIRDTFEALNPFDILGKLSKYLSRLNTFLIIFTETGTQIPETTVLVNSISDIVLAKDSKTCVIYVSGGTIMFITTELDAPNKIAEFRVPKSVQVIREWFETRNPFDILGKLARIRSGSDTFLVYFTAGVAPIVQQPVALPPGQQQQRPGGFRLPGFRLPYFKIPFLGGWGGAGAGAGINFGFNFNFKLPTFGFLARPSVAVGGAARPGGGFFGTIQKAMGFGVGGKAKLNFGLSGKGKGKGLFNFGR